MEQPTFSKTRRGLVTSLEVIDTFRVSNSFFVGYSLNSKAFRVFNSRTRIVEENLHISVGIQRLLDDLRVTTAQVCVTAAKL
ncbi:hypothetical protein Tco_0346215, partial [Tanacetum coccineum]